MVTLPVWTFTCQSYNTHHDCKIFLRKRTWRKGMFLALCFNLHFPAVYISLIRSWSFANRWRYKSHQMKERFMFSMFFLIEYLEVSIRWTSLTLREQRIDIWETFLLLNTPNFTLYIRKTNSEAILATIAEFYYVWITW